jgi:hypothetical protein
MVQSLDYDGGRQVTAYVPPVAPEAVVFAGDGQLIPQWGGVLEADGAPPVMIVGTHRLDEEMPRLREYSPVFDAQRFAAHEKFFVRTSASGRGHVSESRCPPNARRWLVSLPAENSP